MQPKTVKLSKGQGLVPQGMQAAAGEDNQMEVETLTTVVEGSVS